MDKSVKKGIILVLVAGTFWGLSGVLGQYIMQRYGISPNWLVPYRLTFAGAILVFINIFKTNRNIFTIWKNDAVRLLTFAIFGITLTQYSYFSGVNASNAGTSTVLQQLSIVMIMLYTCLREKKLPDIKQSICLVLALAGVFFMATHGNINTLVISEDGLFWGITCAMAVTIYTLVPRKLIATYGSSITTGWGMLTGGILLMTFFKPWTMEVETSPTILQTLAIIIIFGTVIPFSLYLKGVNLAGASRASMLSNIEPLTAALVSALWLGDKYTTMDILGAVCILSTIFILAKDDKKK